MAAVVTQGGDGYGAAQAFAAAGRPTPIIIMGNRQDELAWWKEQKDANGYETMSVSIAPGVSTLAFWVAQQILDGKEVPKDLTVPFLRIEQDGLEEALEDHAGGRGGQCRVHARGRAGGDHGRRRRLIVHRPVTTEPVIAASGAAKAFGAVRALDGVDFAVAPGECVGLVGHNGAGKSTLVNLLNGGARARRRRGPARRRTWRRCYDVAAARAAGIRCVFQELSLCPNLTVAENVRVLREGTGGRGWRGRAGAAVAAMLDRIFPGHGIAGGAGLGGSRIAQRQMVEIAIAFLEIGAPPRLVILDEPTSSLDAQPRRASCWRKFAGSSPRAGRSSSSATSSPEVLEISDRIVVMKDGRVVADRPAAGLRRPRPRRRDGQRGAGARRGARGPAADRCARRRQRAGSAPGRARSSASPASPATGRARCSPRSTSPRRADWAAPNRAPPSSPATGRSTGCSRSGRSLWNTTASVLPDMTRRGLLDRGRRGRLRRRMAGAARDPDRRRWRRRSCRSPAATSRRRSSPARSGPARRWC